MPTVQPGGPVPKPIHQGCPFVRGQREQRNQAEGGPVQRKPGLEQCPIPPSHLRQPDDFAPVQHHFIGRKAPEAHPTGQPVQASSIGAGIGRSEGNSRQPEHPQRCGPDLPEPAVGFGYVGEVERVGRRQGNIKHEQVRF